MSLPCIRLTSFVDAPIFPCPFLQQQSNKENRSSCLCKLFTLLDCLPPSCLPHYLIPTSLIKTASYRNSDIFLSWGRRRKFSYKKKKAQSLAACAISSFYLNCLFPLSCKWDVLWQEGCFCLQSTQTHTFPLITCLAWASGLLCNMITKASLPTHPSNHRVRRRHCHSGCQGRCWRGRESRLELWPGPWRSWETAHCRDEGRSWK